jgi:hypothetical protein
VRCIYPSPPVGSGAKIQDSSAAAAIGGWGVHRQRTACFGSVIGSSPTYVSQSPPRMPTEISTRRLGLVSLGKENDWQGGRNRLMAVPLQNISICPNFESRMRHCSPGPQRSPPSLVPYSLRCRRPSLLLRGNGCSVILLSAKTAKGVWMSCAPGISCVAPRFERRRQSRDMLPAPKYHLLR